jgi:hypothetical protein
MKLYELDESNIDSFTNQAPPHMPKWFVDELTAIGGKQLDGTPNLRVVWGQSETKFACGKERIKYPSTFYNENETIKFRLTDLETKEVKECTYGEFMEAKKAYDAVDPTIKYLPEFKVSRSVEWVGIPRWVIEQYKPVIMFQDSPSNWEKNRYGWWFNPDTRKREWTDINGPFPYNGRYEHFLTIESDEHKYKTPSEREITCIRKALQGRESYKKTKSDAAYVQDYIDAQEARLIKSEQEIADEIASDLAPHVNQMYETKIKFYK